MAQDQAPTEQQADVEALREMIARAAGRQSVSEQMDREVTRVYARIDPSCSGARSNNTAHQPWGGLLRRVVIFIAFRNTIRAVCKRGHCAVRIEERQN